MDITCFRKTSLLTRSTTIRSRQKLLSPQHTVLHLQGEARPVISSQWADISCCRDGSHCYVATSSPGQSTPSTLRSDTFLPRHVSSSPDCGYPHVPPRAAPTDHPTPASIPVPGRGGLSSTNEYD